jgi:drug/metabolite transporter (DMT)-like permease
MTAPAPQRRASAWLPLAAIGVTVVLWASAFVAIRYAGRDVSAGGLALGRLIAGSAALGSVIAIRSRRAPLSTPRRWPARQDWPRLLTLGVLWFGLYNLTLNQGEHHVDAGTAAMLVGIGPLLITLLAGLLLREGFPRPLIAGCAVAFVGVLLIGVATSESGADPIGVVLCVVSAVLYAFGVVTQKPLLAALPGINVTFIACLIGVVVCLPFAPSLAHDLSHASAASVWWVIYLGVFPTAIAFTTWAYALARSTAGRTGASTYLSPPIAILISWAFLGETPAALALVGGATCLLGVYVARRAPRRRPNLAPVGANEATPGAEPVAPGGSALRETP